MSKNLRGEHPTEAEISSAVDTLARLEAGRLPYPLFMQLARLSTSATVELVPLRENDMHEVEVLLLQRPAGDPWEGQWHVPGTVILPTDSLAHPHDYDDPLRRLTGANGEIDSGISVVGHPVILDTERRRTLRGDELSVIHYVEVEGEPIDGEFFPMSDFPDRVPSPGVIDHQVGFVQRAVSSYMNDKRRKW